MLDQFLQAGTLAARVARRLARAAAPAAPARGGALREYARPSSASPGGLPTAYRKAVLGSTVALVLLGVAVSVGVPIDPAIALPVDLPEPLPIAAGVGYWTALAILASTSSAMLPGSGWVSLSALPMVAAAALGGPTAALWVAFLTTEVREFRLPRLHMLWNHVGEALPLVLAAAMMEPFRPSAGASDQGLLLLGLASTLAIGVGYLVANALFIAWGSTLVLAYDLRATLRRNVGPQLTVASLLPLAWLATESYVRMGWWTPLLFGVVLVTWQMATQRAWMHRAAHEDHLTGLTNRRAFELELNRTLVRARRTGERTGLLYLDLDDFKPVNDKLGHDTGDRLLREIGQRLQASVRPGDAVARIGGDEFAVLLPNLADVRAGRVIARRLMATFADPWSELPPGHGLRASIGVAISDPDDETDGEELLRAADRDMYAVKRRQKGRN